MVIYLPCLYPALAVLTIVADRSRWERRKVSRSSELRDAVLELLMECRFNATRLADVAQRAGVNKRTLYFYFAGKDELFKAVIRKVWCHNLPHLEELNGENPGSSRDLIRRILKGWWDSIGATRLGGIPNLIVAESGNFPEMVKFYPEEMIHR